MHLFLSSAAEMSLKQTPLVATWLAKNRLSIDSDLKRRIAGNIPATQATVTGPVERSLVLVWLVTERRQVIVERQAGATIQRDHGCQLGASLSTGVASCNNCNQNLPQCEPGTNCSLCCSGASHNTQSARVYHCFIIRVSVSRAAVEWYNIKGGGGGGGEGGRGGVATSPFFVAVILSQS